MFAVWRPLDENALPISIRTQLISILSSLSGSQWLTDSDQDIRINWVNKLLIKIVSNTAKRSIGGVDETIEFLSEGMDISDYIIVAMNTFNNTCEEERIEMSWVLIEIGRAFSSKGLQTANIYRVYTCTTEPCQASPAHTRAGTARL